MAINDQLYRFGADEFAVGHLINGTLPDDDAERWKIVEAPRWHIKKLVDEHLRAQAALRECQDTGRPFVLFLRSFATEHHRMRIDKEVRSIYSLSSLNLQEWLEQHLADDKIPLVKLHGGSDGFLSDVNGEGKVLSTHAHNWLPVATELIQSASAIVFLVSHMTQGVVQEFDLIRAAGQTRRCLVLIVDAQHTPDRGAARTENIAASLSDFPHVFEQASANPGAAHLDGLGQALISLLKGARMKGQLNETLRTGFTYLEPNFVASKDYDETEVYIWRQMRLLRVMFDDTYWAALKAHGIAFEHFTFPGAWKVAHQLYGLALATADVAAIRESLRYLELLYLFRGADFALVFPHLAAQYGEIAQQMNPDGPPDTEARYAQGPDPLRLPSRMDLPVELFMVAEKARQNNAPEQATYLYQAALICALRAKDGDEAERRWITANIARDWAKFQSHGQQEWALVNYALALKLYRDVAAADPAKAGEVALCLNNMGSLQFRRQDFKSANAAFSEAITIRRGLSRDGKGYMVDLYTSLANLGLLMVETGSFDRAHALYGEALDICEQRLASEPGAVLDLARQRIWMSRCLAKMPGRKADGLEHARRAEALLGSVERINPQAATDLRQAIDEVAKANAGG